MRTRYLVSLTLAFALNAVSNNVAADSPAASWGAITQPTQGTSQSIGTFTSGCIAGAAPLPLNGTGYQVMRVSRHRYFGHPALVAAIEKLGRSVASAQLGTLLIGDLGQARGGPMVSGHRSHQTGLDVDIWFLLSEQASQRILSANERETWNATSVVDMQNDVLDYGQWSLAHARVLESAGRLPEVDRIFVHPRIKQALCQSKSPDSTEWLRKIRPWWKHDDHFHVRLQCPPDSLHCQRQEPLPAGDGCDAGLDWWFSEEAKQPSKSKPVPPPPLPALCEKVLREP